MSYRPSARPPARPYLKRAPSKLERRNYDRAFEALAMGCTVAPVMEVAKVRAKPKRQKEERVNDIVRRMKKRHKSVHLYRNARGPAYLPNGQLITRGIGPNGFPDFVGYVMTKITPEMVGQWKPFFAAPECKTEEGRLDQNQKDIAKEIRERGGFAGVVRTEQDFLRVLGFDVERGS